MGEEREKGEKQQMNNKNAWLTGNADMEAVESFSRRYRIFLDEGKTERECVTKSIQLAEEKGFVNLQTIIGNSKSLKPGDRVYYNHMGKALLLFIIGNDLMEKGMNILGAHIDSPRIDIKQNPVYEDNGLCYLDTHYYGGIKKYQWLSIPLALHGIVVLKNGGKINIVIGEKEDDPVFCITDLLPHLAREQMEKAASKLIEGESLNLLIGSRPEENEEKEAVRNAILKILMNQYGMDDDDFLSSELEIVPAGLAKDMGIDRSMILAYGHDDRSCAFPSLMAMLCFEGIPKYTLCCVLTDKEEIGSVGATGMGSRFFENVTAEVMNAAGQYSELSLRRALANSRMLSSDVSAAFDPNFSSAFEPKNSAHLGHGICFNKYTGSRGKSGSNDANAEFIAEIRQIMGEADVTFQMSELGKVDQGGGGTIAYLCAKYGMNVIDCGIPVLSMHAPWEVISKIDLWEGFRCYQAFLEKAHPLF